MKTTKFFPILFVFLVSILAACQNKPTAALPEEYPPPQATKSQTEGYPAPSTVTPFIINEIPTPTKGTATIVGHLMVNKEAPVPIETTLLALAKVIPGPDGTPMVARFNRNEAPHTLTDENGLFVFTNIPPGQYAIIVDRISDAFMLNHPDTGEDFIISAVADEVTDLGAITYNTLPGYSEGK